MGSKFAENESFLVTGARGWGRALESWEPLAIGRAIDWRGPPSDWGRLERTGETFALGGDGWSESEELMVIISSGSGAGFGCAGGGASSSDESSITMISCSTLAGALCLGLGRANGGWAGRGGLPRFAISK